MKIKKNKSDNNNNNNIEINNNKIKMKLTDNPEYNKIKLDKEEIKLNNINQFQKLRRNISINLNSMKIKNFELKLIDFRYSKIFSQYKKNFEDTIGTLIYCFPEVLKNNYNKKCDI